MTDANLPTGTTLLAPAFVELPAPVGVDCPALVHKHLFETNYAELNEVREIVNRHKQLRELVEAGRKSISPSPEQAVRLFSQLTRWVMNTPEIPSNPLAALQCQHYWEESIKLACSALSQLAVPSLSSNDRTEERAQELISLVKGKNTGEALTALVYFIHIPLTRADIVRSIRRAVGASHFEAVAGGAKAIEKWAELYPEHNPDGLPKQLGEQLVSAIERRSVGLHALIYCARRLVELKTAGEDDCALLEEALGDLTSASAYENVDWDSKGAVSISLVRAECVRLSNALHEAGLAGPNATAWLELAATDALPEVRFALF